MFGPGPGDFEQSSGSSTGLAATPLSSVWNRGLAGLP
jgi:hypothetical protein